MKYHIMRCVDVGLGSDEFVVTKVSGFVLRLGDLRCFE